MINHEFRMHPSHREKLQLADVLAFVPPNDWSWTLDELDGIGERVHDLVPQGGALTGLTWEDVLEIARRVEDLWWFHLIGFARVCPQSQGAAVGSFAALDLYARDSTYWTVDVPNVTEMGLTVVGSLRLAFPEPPKRWTESIP